MKPAPNTDNLEKDLKASPEWRARLSTWGVYAAATSATLAMASNADASIIYGAANVSASITPIPNVSSIFATTGFQIGGHHVEIGIGLHQSSSFYAVLAAIRGVGPHPVLFADQGSGSLMNFNPGLSIFPASCSIAGPAGISGMAQRRTHRARTPLQPGGGVSGR
jgi:hypothetical protein